MRNLVFLFLALLCFCSCKDKEPDGMGTSFDRTVLLQNYADNLIHPAFLNAAQKAEALRVAWQNFEVERNETNLEVVKVAWKSAYVAFQAANAYNFGPAGEIGIKKSLVEEVATFPVNTVLMETFIENGDFSLNNFDRDTRGFLAIEYLLFEKNVPETVALFDQIINNRAGYAKAIIWRLAQDIQTVSDAWQTNYRAEFVAADGTDVGSSISLLYNEFVRSYEAIKNFKIGLPAGFQAGQTEAAPNLAEAYFSGFSREMLAFHLENSRNIYLGRSTTGTDGIGLDDYLESALNGPALLVETEAQWAYVLSTFAAIPTDKPLASLMAEGHPSIAAFHTELQKMTRFYKSDLSSLLGISITYVSGDGD